ncbi:MAG: alpha/beta fold hydrolase [Planctomycetes bacterium]|nr:alpha/beta fold hydrolase [Planctomycetota bacterium]
MANFDGAGKAPEYENPWLPRRGPKPHPALRLICFPHAGGGGAVYHRWSSLLPAEIDVLPVLLPGRERRIQEPPRRDLRGLAAEAADAIAPLADVPLAFFGHSMGALLAFETIRDLRRRGASPPLRLFAAAYAAPQTPRRSDSIHELPDREFLIEIQERFSGVPPQVAGDPDLLNLFLPILRADVAMIETYQYVDEPPLECPITALGGADDQQVSIADLAAWRSQTAGPFQQKIVMGGHFFVAERQAEVVRIVRAALGAHLA